MLSAERLFGQALGEGSLVLVEVCCIVPEWGVACMLHHVDRCVRYRSLVPICGRWLDHRISSAMCNQDRRQNPSCGAKGFGARRNTGGAPHSSGCLQTRVMNLTGQERKENTGAPSNLIQLCFRTSVVCVVVGNPGSYSRSKERDCPRPRPGSARAHYAPGRRIGVPYRPGVWRGNRAMLKSVGGQSAVLSSPILC